MQGVVWGQRQVSGDGLIMKLSEPIYITKSSLGRIKRHNGCSGLFAFLILSGSVDREFDPFVCLFGADGNLWNMLESEEGSEVYNLREIRTSL